MKKERFLTVLVPITDADVTSVYQSLEALESAVTPNLENINNIYKVNGLGYYRVWLNTQTNKYEYHSVVDREFPELGKPLEIFDFTYDATRMGTAPTISAQNVMWYAKKDTEGNDVTLEGMWKQECHVSFNGENFYLKQIPTSSKSNEDARYRYDIDFISERVVLENVYIYDVVSPFVSSRPISESAQFSFYGDINELAKRINASLINSGLAQPLLRSGVTPTSFLTYEEFKEVGNGTYTGTKSTNDPYPSVTGEHSVHDNIYEHFAGDYNKYLLNCVYDVVDKHSIYIGTIESGFEEIYDGKLRYSGYECVIGKDKTGATSTSEEKLITFDNNTIHEALQHFHDTFGLQYYIYRETYGDGGYTGKTIIVVGDCQYDLADMNAGNTDYIRDSDGIPTTTHPFDYGIDDALLSKEKTNTTDKIITRITGFGSEENIPWYYPNPTADGWIKPVFKTDDAVDGTIDLEYPELETDDRYEVFLRNRIGDKLQFGVLYDSIFVGDFICTNHYESLSGFYKTYEVRFPIADERIIHSTSGPHGTGLPYVEVIRSIKKRYIGIKLSGDLDICTWYLDIISTSQQNSNTIILSLTSLDIDPEDLERLKRGHYFLNLPKGEYTANLHINEPTSLPAHTNVVYRYDTGYGYVYTNIPCSSIVVTRIGTAGYDVPNYTYVYKLEVTKQSGYTGDLVLYYSNLEPYLLGERDSTGVDVFVKSMVYSFVYIGEDGYFHIDKYDRYSSSGYTNPTTSDYGSNGVFEIYPQINIFTNEFGVGSKIIDLPSRGMSFPDGTLSVEDDVWTYTNGSTTHEMTPLDSIEFQRVKYITPQKNLMPELYVKTDGDRRFYNAINYPLAEGTPDAMIGEAQSTEGIINPIYYKKDTSTHYDFENVYIQKIPKEHIESFDDVKPTITGQTNYIRLYSQPADWSTNYNKYFVKNETEDYIPNDFSTWDDDNEYYASVRIDVVEEFAYDELDNDEIWESIDNGSVSGEYKHPYFFAKLRPLGFNLFDLALQDDMTISLTTGDCGACNFKIAVDEDTKKNPVQVWEYDVYSSDGSSYVKVYSQGDIRRYIDTEGLYYKNDDDEYEQITIDSYRKDEFGNIIVADFDSQDVADGEVGSVKLKSNVVFEGDVVTSGRYIESQQNTTYNYVWVALTKDTDSYGTIMPAARPDYSDGVLSVYIRPKSIADVHTSTSSISDDEDKADKFVITNIKMPQVYLRKAERELSRRLVEYMYDNNYQKFNFSIRLSRIYMAQNEEKDNKINENSVLYVNFNNKIYRQYVKHYTYKMSKDAVLPEITVDMNEELSVYRTPSQQSENRDNSLSDKIRKKLQKTLIETEGRLTRRTVSKMDNVVLDNNIVIRKSGVSLSGMNNHIEQTKISSNITKINLDTNYYDKTDIDDNYYDKESVDANYGQIVRGIDQIDRALRCAYVTIGEQSGQLHYSLPIERQNPKEEPPSICRDDDAELWFRTTTTLDK